MNLDEIDLHFGGPSPNELSNAPVSPVSNPDQVLSDRGATDSKIIIGGGSLNSTLSAGEGGNELVKVFKEIEQEKQK